jgi:VPDSG-CTERM motif
MKKNLFVLGIAAALAGSGIPALADPISLTQLRDDGQSITMVDKVFSDFNFVGTGLGSLTVEVSIDEAGIHLLTISGSASPNGGLSGTLQYTVSTISGEALIRAIDQSLDPGENSLVTALESVSAGGSTVGSSSVNSAGGDLTDPPAEANDDLEFDDVQSQITVTTTLFVAGSSTFTLVQSFHQEEPTSVPDGGVTLLLLGGALSGLALIRRRSWIT